MAYRDLNDGFVSTQPVSSPKKTYLPNFPSDTRLVSCFPQLDLMHRSFGKFHTMQWIDFVLDNPDEIWERIIDEDTTYYYYFYFLGSDSAVPVFVVELYFDDDQWIINNHTIVISSETISQICKFTRVYSRAKEWEKESFIKRLNDKALEKYDTNELTDARRLIDAAIDLSGAESAYLLNNRGLICWKMGKIDQAKTDFLASINLDTENGDPYFNLGLIYFDESSFSKALYYLEKAVDIDPTDSQFLTELAHLYLELGKESQALTLFKKAFENNPTDAQIDFHLGYYFLYKKRNPRSALKYYKKGLQKDPGDQFAIADSAIAHWVTGNAKKTAQLRKNAPRPKVSYAIYHQSISISQYGNGKL